MRKSTYIRILSYCIAAAVAVGGFAGAGWYRAIKAETVLQHGYARAYQQIASDLSTISADLSKVRLHPVDSVFLTLSADIYKNASSAVRTLENLPSEGEEYNALINYVNRIADYSAALARNRANGKGISNRDIENLSALSSATEKITECIQGGCTESYDARFFASVSGALSGLDSELTELHDSLSETPVLLYDGPFSDHITETVPYCVTAHPDEMSVEDSKKVLCDFFDLDPSEITQTGEGDGKLPVWCFSFQKSDQSYYAQTAKNGGQLILLLSGCSGEDMIGTEEAAGKAEEAVSALGFDPLIPTYQYKENGILYVNFASVQSDVVCYPDLVQIGICLSDGKVCYVQATGYASNHRSRDDLTPAVSETQARKQLPASLSMKDSRLAVIASEGEIESLCYEYLGTDGNDDYLFYIDASGGTLTRILKLLYSDNGTLTL